MGIPIDPNPCGMLEDCQCDDPAEWAIRNPWKIQNSRAEYRASLGSWGYVGSYVPVFAGRDYMIIFTVTEAQFNFPSGGFHANLGGAAGPNIRTPGTYTFTITAINDSHGGGWNLDNFSLTDHGMHFGTDYAFIDDFYINYLLSGTATGLGFAAATLPSVPMKGMIVGAGATKSLTLASIIDGTNCLVKYET